MPRTIRPSLLLLVIALLSCEGAQHRLLLVFPSDALMQATAEIKLEVYRLSGSEDLCPALREERGSGGLDPLLSVTQLFPFGAETIGVGELGGGRYAFAVTAWNRNDPKQRFLTGCTTLQITPRRGRQMIRVELGEFRGCCGSAAGCTDAAELTCYDGVSTTRGMGSCRAGTASCSGGFFTTCQGQVLPSEELCNGRDDDCDGTVDNVAAERLSDDPQHCGRCGRRCKNSCTEGTCDEELPDSGALDGGVDAAADGPRADGPERDGRSADQGQTDVLRPDVLRPDTVPTCTSGTFECLANGAARQCVTGSWQAVGPCPLGCNAATKACRIPSNIAADVVSLGKGSSDSSTYPEMTIHTDTGEISAGATILRAAGTGMNEASGIYFTTVPQSGGAPALAVFATEQLTFAQGTTVHVVGPRALVLVAKKTLTINGVIDVAGREVTGGSGGFNGGLPDQAGSGPGGGEPGEGGFVSAFCSSGGGGAGFGGRGGDGGTSTCGGFAFGAGGATYGTPELIPLIGGSGGSGGTTVPGGTEAYEISVPGRGGGGGGALQLVAGERIAIGGTGRINANAEGSEECKNAGGSGAGSGGAILLEAPVITVATGAVLAANGGGGGGGDCN